MSETAASVASPRTFARFSKRQRTEHILVMSLFIVLALTGFPQKFHDTGFARFTVALFGGLDSMRFWHRFAGIAFSILTVVHLAVSAAGVLLGRLNLSLVPNRQDFRDAVQQMKWYLGTASAPARFDRFDYRQKFEYWGLVLGGLVMISTGFLLLYPVDFSRLLPAELIPVAKVAHSNEGLMAFLVVITWHIFNAHLSPEVFPFDTSIFTGRIAEHRLKHEHPLEWERLTGQRADGAGPHAEGGPASTEGHAKAGTTPAPPAAAPPAPASTDT